MLICTRNIYYYYYQCWINFFIKNIILFFVALIPSLWMAGSIFLNFRTFLFGMDMDMFSWASPIITCWISINILCLPLAIISQQTLVTPGFQTSKMSERSPQLHLGLMFLQGMTCTRPLNVKATHFSAGGNHSQTIIRHNRNTNTTLLRWTLTPRDMEAWKTN